MCARHEQFACMQAATVVHLHACCTDATRFPASMRHACCTDATLSPAGTRHACCMHANCMCATPVLQCIHYTNFVEDPINVNGKYKKIQCNHGHKKNCSQCLSFMFFSSLLLPLSQQERTVEYGICFLCCTVVHVLPASRICTVKAVK